jgi:hypothetical protein
MCSKAFPMKDRFCARDWLLARGILNLVTRYSSRMDAHDVYRRVLDDLQPDAAWRGAICDLPSYETGVAICQRLTFAALAIVEQEHAPR